MVWQCSQPALPGFDIAAELQRRSKKYDSIIIVFIPSKNCLTFCERVWAELILQYEYHTALRDFRPGVLEIVDK